MEQAFYRHTLFHGVKKAAKAPKKTGGLPRIAAARYDSPISLPGAGDGISKFTVKR
jgi:hypothetical protein